MQVGRLPTCEAGFQSAAGSSRNPPLKLRRCYNLQPGLAAFFFEDLDLQVTVFLLIELRAFVDGLLAEPEQAIYNPSQFAGHGFDGLGGAEGGPQPPVLRTQVALAAQQCAGRVAQGLASAAHYLASVTSDDLARAPSDSGSLISFARALPRTHRAFKGLRVVTDTQVKLCRLLRLFIF